MSNNRIIAFVYDAQTNQHTIERSDGTTRTYDYRARDSFRLQAAVGRMGTRSVGIKGGYHFYGQPPATGWNPSRFFHWLRD